MQTKGIPFWEQHLERIVLAVAGLMLLAFIALQFVGDPSLVEKGGTTFSASTVDRQLEEAAGPLDSKLAQNAPSPIDISSPASAFGTFASALEAGVAPADMNPEMQYVLRIRAVTDEPVDAEYVVPQLPAPQGVLASQYFDSILDTEVQQHPELQQRLPSAPYDVTWISTAATFDLNAVLAAYEQVEPGSELHAIPQSWYGGRVDVMDVIVEREEMINDGWGNPITLDPLSGRWSFRRDLSEKIDRDLGEYLLQQARDPAFGGDVIQPAFYGTKNSSWTIPEPEIVMEDEGLDEDARELRMLHLRLRQFRQQQEQDVAKLEELGGPITEADDPPTPPAGGGGLGGGGGGGRPGGPPAGPPGGGLGAGSGAGGNPGRRSSGADQDLRIRRQLMNKIDGREGQIARLEMRIRALDPDDVVDDEAASGEADGVITLWAHDLDVEPGKTYRYRVTMQLYNPFFARTINLKPEQGELAESYVMASVTSDWSAPIMAEPPLHLFVTKATAIGQGSVGRLGLGQVTAEVYRYHDGGWWKKQFTVEPGDQIGRLDTPRRRDGTTVDVDIDFTTEWFVLDIVADLGTRNTGDGISRSGQSAVVLLQNVRTGEVAPVRAPWIDANSVERDWLKVESELTS